MSTPDPRSDVPPEVPVEDAAEQRLSAAGDDAHGQPPALAPEASEADALDQVASAAPGEHRADRALPLEADEADAAEQAVVVPLDEDEGRT